MKALPQPPRSSVPPRAGVSAAESHPKPYISAPNRLSQARSTLKRPALQAKTPPASRIHCQDPRRRPPQRPGRHPGRESVTFAGASACASAEKEASTMTLAASQHLLLGLCGSCDILHQFDSICFRSRLSTRLSRAQTLLGSGAKKLVEHGKLCRAQPFSLIRQPLKCLPSFG